MTESKAIRETIAQAPNRRRFVQSLGMASAALGAVTAGAGSASAQAAITDLDILNFALNLEYLEAEFYTYATTGNGIERLGIGVSGSGAQGATTGGRMVSFPTADPTIRRIAEELAYDEQTHVTLLRSTITALGGQPVAKPAINLGALGVGFGSVAEFLTVARVFEDLGVTAYGGAAPLITDKTILGYAARILVAEAEHAGAIRLLVAQNAITTAAVDGVDVPPPPTGWLYFSLDNNAISAVRTPGEVLYLAYGAPNAVAGAFFPAGVNGLVNMSSASAAAGPMNTLTASPNPIPVTGSANKGTTTISWNAPSAQVIEIRIGSPSGNLFTTNSSSGSMQTGNWVSDGMTFYLQDRTGGKPLTAANTLAKLTVMFSRS